MADQMIQDRISISTDDHGVADVRLARADKRNALDPAMFSGLIEATGVLQEPNQCDVHVVLEWAQAQ